MSTIGGALVANDFWWHFLHLLVFPLLGLRVIEANKYPIIVDFGGLNFIA